MPKITLELDRCTKGTRVGEGNISGYLDAIARSRRNKWRNHKAAIEEVADMIIENDPDLCDPKWGYVDGDECRYYSHDDSDLDVSS